MRARPDMDSSTTYSTHDAARILQSTEPQVRTWARMGGIRPTPGAGGRLEFTFQQLLLLRTTRGLLESGVPARRVKQIWSTLKRQLPDDLPLTSIRIRADGGRAIAWDGSAPWQPDSGQFVLDFTFGEGAEARSAPSLEVLRGSTGTLEPAQVQEAEPGGETRKARKEVKLATIHALPLPARSGGHSSSEAVPPPPPSEASPSAQRPSATDEPPSLTADQWFLLGCELESSSPPEARQAYLQAIVVDPAYADAQINLGRMEHRAKDLAAAEARYRRAIQCAPGDPIAHFNLGVLLEDRKCPHAAVESYEKAIAYDPDFADAHYNLGLLLEQLGQRADAMRHLMAAHRLYES